MIRDKVGTFGGWWKGWFKNYDGWQPFFLLPSICSTRFFISSGLSGKNPSRTAKTISEAGSMNVRFSRKNSLMILFILFLLTALFTPWMLIPSLFASISFGVWIIVSLSLLILLPLLYTFLYSQGFRSRHDLGSVSGFMRRMWSGSPCLHANGTFCHYTARRWRPLALRRLITAWPALVFILCLKPWVRWRFKLLGWKVLLLIVFPSE